MSAIHLQNLVKKFGDFTALKTMDLAISDGEFMALLGPSGCGKSTTMNMIAGMEEPTGGKILFGERDMAGVPMGRRGVGFVFQNYAIFTHMTVRQNLAYGPKMRGAAKAEIDRRVGAIAEMLQLTPLLDRKADRLSVNILQRVAIGRSAIMEPAIFLLDEPLSNVDAAFRAVMRTELKQLQRQFRQTMVYVTHDQLEAMTMADRIAVMDHGVLQQVGTPLEVYNDPANVFVARFIGAPGMNLLKGRPAESDRGLVVDLGPLGVTPPLPGELAAAMRGARGEVLYGFRPEQATLVQNGQGLAMPVTFVERIGARTIVHLGQGEAAVKTVFDNDVGLTIGDTAVIAPTTSSVRVFDAATGRAMRVGG
ncbi:ABC transporter ATP-binding protein [Mesorhizobium sp. M7A.F.Ca.CA.001.07.2.1]|uniref:ABC transporter ATP-binding protein n=3 Tax=Phyllobacteriaceae TaxID=69277 RepID=UPI000FCA3DAE|nr:MULTISPECIES: ABC transporter ATP-binding protein [Mesorhizobium]RVB24372.1 ABC transporter ATP-binding protein [Mesorhizobium sp. M7A.F.Ca.CA.004.05.1.1]MCF6122250.1 ABC transporter ATP-binding protein [Mesorhizobium ciceri]MCQ8812834.1 ABC transporter ATP-binding protein [Mesorhizobium sp. SEMIA396]RUX73521.1 ABC transporter ATP-binding protein [Mesorhizobium sp. M7A.F.Ca.CA.004.08.2.1]RUX87494.1 ABC transporter ATP-binding protein [Mesorhizobium sp. M7A.F.Ca.CA.004.08.1.1]